MRLIDADALLLNAEQYRCGRGEYSRMVDVWHIEHAPTIEAEPVRHGRWERTDDPEFFMGDFECSECEHLECDIDTTCLTPGVNCLYYCPNCGAKMQE